MCTLCFDRLYHFSLFSPQVYSAKKKNALKHQTDRECNYKKNLHFKQQVAIFSGSFWLEMLNGKMRPAVENTGIFFSVNTTDRPSSCSWSNRIHIHKLRMNLAKMHVLHIFRLILISKRPHWLKVKYVFILSDSSYWSLCWGVMTSLNM